MNKRSPWLMYIAAVITGGPLFYLWLYLLMRDANRLEGRELFNLTRHGQVLLIGVISFVILAIYLFMTFGEVSVIRLFFVVITMMLGLSLSMYLLVMFLRVSAYLTRPLNYSHPAAHIFLLFLLLFIGGLSFVILQSQSNQLIDRRALA
jgi:hypothetical protein